MGARRTTRRSADPGLLQVEYWPLDRLVPYARNARTHSAEQLAEIAGSIRTFGFTNPILVGEDGDIVAGHGRLAAARVLGLNEVPVIVLFGLTELQRRQLVLADNRIALNAGWDLEMLKLELKDLSELGADLAPLGFSDAELEAALSSGGSPGLIDEDEAPAQSAERSETTSVPTGAPLGPFSPATSPTSGTARCATLAGIHRASSDAVRERQHVRRNGKEAVDSAGFVEIAFPIATG